MKRPTNKMIALHIAARPHRDWSPQSRKMVFEARTIPGNLIGIGYTPDDAARGALAMLAWELDEEIDRDAWYARAWKQMTAEDLALFSSAAQQMGTPQPVGHRVRSESTRMQELAC